MIWILYSTQLFPLMIISFRLKSKALLIKNQALSKILKMSTCSKHLAELATKVCVSLLGIFLH